MGLPKRFIFVMEELMTAMVNALPLKEQEETFLLLAALFDGEFSIDWVQALSEAKATQIMKAFDRFDRDGLLKKHDIGIFSFVDAKKKQQLQDSLPTRVAANLSPPDCRVVAE